MIDTGQFALFLAGAIALNLTPGPDVIFVLSQGTGRGTRPAIAKLNY
jgi:threonine/homoserine/homoserine lactone efflux protein